MPKIYTQSSAPKKKTLQAGIYLLHHIRVGVCRPVSTRLSHDQGDGHIFLDIDRALQDIRIQATRNMPGDVAMEGPDAGVVGVDLPYDVAVGREHLHIAPQRVVGVGDGGAVPVPGSFVQDKHVVAVKMHGMGRRRGVVDHHADGRVGAEVLDVPRGGIGEVSLVGQEEYRIVVVGAERLLVELPEENIRAVDDKANIEVFDRGWSLGFERVVGY